MTEGHSTSEFKALIGGLVSIVAAALAPKLGLPVEQVTPVVGSIAAIVVAYIGGRSWVKK